MNEINENGYPNATSWRDMEPEHQLIYWRHQARKHEQRSDELARKVDELAAHAGHLEARITELITAQAEYLDVKGCAKRAGLSTTTVHRMIERGDLPASRVRGTDLLRIRRADLEAALEPVEPGTTLPPRPAPPKKVGPGRLMRPEPVPATEITKGGVRRVR